MNQPPSKQSFIWPDPFAGPLPGAVDSLPLDKLATASTRSLFGAISNLDARAAAWVDSWLASNPVRQLRLVISIHPTCRTSTADLEALLRLADTSGGKAVFRLFPEATLADRSSNLLCFFSADGQASLSLGPSGNLGFDDRSASRGNLASAIGVDTLDECRKWFDHLWGSSAPLDAATIDSMPRFVLPPGDADAARLWEDYRRQCAAGDVSLVEDPVTGDTVLSDMDDVPLPSPTEAIDIPKLDRLSSKLTHLYSLGLLVTIDKQSRIPPLEAPVKPEWFGLESFRQRGAVSVQTSMKVAPFEDAALRKIDRLRRVSGELLPRFTFALADGMRWIPRGAIALFEQALTDAHNDAKGLLGAAVGPDVDAFLDSQVPRIRHDAQRMYEAYHPGGRIPDYALANILAELRTRLGRAMEGRLIPKVSYSPIAFNPAHDTEWSSPWGPAFSLLKGVAEFPRHAMTDRFFWRGIHVQEDALVHAMNVADDAIVAEYGGRKAMQCAERQLQSIKRLDESGADARTKCEALWALTATGDEAALLALVAAAAPD